MGEIVYDGFNKIEIIEVEGMRRERVIFKSAVAALVVDSENKVAIVRQLRPTIGMHTLEIPAGVLDKNISPLETMLEELKEECDLDLNLITEVKEASSYFMMTGSSNATMTIYYVKYDGIGHSKKIEGDDVSEVKWIPIGELYDLIDKGQICDPKTIIATTYVAQKID